MNTTFTKLLIIFTFAMLQGLAGVLDAQSQFGEAQMLISSELKGPFAIHSADLDQDGFDDLVVASSENLGWYPNLGGGQFSSFTIIDSYSMPNINKRPNQQSIALVDIDNDGDIDILKEDYEFESLVCLVNNGSGIFAGSVIVLSELTNNLRIVTSDIDLDGDEDIIINDFYKAGYIINKGNYEFEHNELLGESVPHWNGDFYETFFGGAWIHATDVNGDSYPDLVACDYTNFQIFLNDTNGLLEFARVENTDFEDSLYVGESSSWYDVHGPAGIINVIEYDVDKDGFIDLLFSSGAYYHFGGDEIDARSRGALWVRNLENETFVKEAFFIKDDFAWLQKADLNNDEVEDVFGININNILHMHFTPDEGIQATSLTDNIRGYSARTWAIPFNLNNDELIDIAFLSDGALTTGYIENLGDFNFGEQQNQSTKIPSTSVMEIADFNNDGFPDIVAGTAGDGAVKVYYSLDEQIVADAVLYENGPVARNLAVSDFDQDGFLDICAIQASNVKCFKNNQGQFDNLVDIEITDSPDNNQLKVADLDNDNLEDLIWFSDADGNLMWAKNLGSFSFANPQIITNNFSQLVRVLEVIDVDGDGLQDILINHYWIKNNGNGNFAPPQQKFDNQIEHVQKLERNTDPPIELITVSSNSLAFPYYRAENDALIALSPWQLDIPASQFWRYEDFWFYDINGDSLIDIIPNSPWINGIFPSQTLWHFNIATTQNPDWVISEYASQLDRHKTIRLVDFDLDNDLDIIAANSHSLFWYENTPDKPKARFETDPCFPSEIRNLSHAYYPNSEVQWDFGNGITSNEPHPQLSVYDEAGEYEILLSICNAAGCDTMVQMIEVTRPINYTIPEYGFVNYPIPFINESTGITNQSWIFGDGEASTSQNPTHFYNEAGVYTVELILTDATTSNCTTNIFQEITILQCQPNDPNLEFQPNFHIPSSGTVDQEVVFSNNTEHVSQVVWDFGDGTSSTAPNATHVYDTPGEYQVMLTLSDPTNFDCSHIFIQTVQIIDPNAEEPSEDFNFMLKPNPAHDFVSVKFDQKVNDVHLSISGVLGNKISSVHLEDTNYLHFSVDELLPGFYFIYVHRDGEILASKKLLVY